MADHEAKAKEAWLTWFDTNPRAKRMDRDAYIAGYLDGFRAAGEGFTPDDVLRLRNLAVASSDVLKQSPEFVAAVRVTVDRIEALLAEEGNDDG